MSNTPSLSPSATMNIGGKERTLRFDFNSLARLEELTGKSAFDSNTFLNIRASDMRAIVWAGLLHESPDLLLEDVGSWLNPGNVKKISEAIAKAFGNNVEDKDAAPLAEADLPLTSQSENA